MSESPARSSLSPERKAEGEDSGLFSSPGDIPDSPCQSPVRYDPICRNHSLRYSGGALHQTDQPVSFDHNFDSLEARPSYKAQSASPPRRRVREDSQSEGETERGPGLTVRHLSRQRQLPPLIRVQADLAAENGAR